jgi:hypothetical protein
MKFERERMRRKRVGLMVIEVMNLKAGVGEVKVSRASLIFDLYEQEWDS